MQRDTCIPLDFDPYLVCTHHRAIIGSWHYSFYVVRYQSGIFRDPVINTAVVHVDPDHLQIAFYVPHAHSLVVHLERLGYGSGIVSHPLESKVCRESLLAVKAGVTLDHSILVLSGSGLLDATRIAVLADWDLGAFQNSDRLVGIAFLLLDHLQSGVDVLAVCHSFEVVWARTDQLVAVLFHFIVLGRVSLGSDLERALRYLGTIPRRCHHLF